MKSLLGPGYLIESPKLRIWSKLRYLSATSMEMVKGRRTRKMMDKSSGLEWRLGS